MIFKCKNCAGNMVYSPEKKQMHCPYCDGLDCEEKLPGKGVEVCCNCGAPVMVTEYISACKCQSCGSYLIFEERISGESTPHLILPFKIGKEAVKQFLKNEFGKRLFVPDDFLSESKLESVEGMYVPFFMFDLHCNYDYQGNAKKVRSWSSGNTTYTETSIYFVTRNMDVEFNKMPVDASVGMDDFSMDLLEPYDYSALETFQEKYMSGFWGEKNSQTAEMLEPRVFAKARSDADALVKATLTGYDSISPTSIDAKFEKRETNYALLPMWEYKYLYRNKKYSFFVNGQSGKIVGKTPLSVIKLIVYSATLFVGLASSAVALITLLEVL